MTPIFKKGDQSEVSNYRPISLLSTIGKAMEKLVHKYVFNFFLEHHVITTLQSSFTAGESTVNQLVDIYNTFAAPLTKAKKFVHFFSILVKPSTGFGIKVFYINCILLVSLVIFWIGLLTTYLRGNNVSFSRAFPQIGQLLTNASRFHIRSPSFLVYINDIVEDINATIQLFADDTSLYLIDDSPLDAAITLNNDVSKV